MTARTTARALRNHWRSRAERLCRDIHRACFGAERRDENTLFVKPDRYMGKTARRPRLNKKVKTDAAVVAREASTKVADEVLRITARRPKPTAAPQPKPESKRATKTGAETERAAAQPAPAPAPKQSARQASPSVDWTCRSCRRSGDHLPVDPNDPSLCMACGVKRKRKPKLRSLLDGMR